MIKVLEKYWAAASILLFLILIPLIYFRPAESQPFMWLAVIVASGTAAALSIEGHYRKYKNRHRNRGLLFRNAGLDVLGILLAILTAVRLATAAGEQMVPRIAQAAESSVSGAGRLAGLLIVLAIGLAAGFLVRWIWGKIMKRLDLDSS